MVFEFSWQIGAGKNSHIPVKWSTIHPPSDDTIFVSWNDGSRFLNCVRPPTQGGGWAIPQTIWSSVWCRVAKGREIRSLGRKEPLLQKFHRTCKPKLSRTLAVPDGSVKEEIHVLKLFLCSVEFMLHATQPSICILSWQISSCSSAWPCLCPA